jgi:hypothetical protein
MVKTVGFKLFFDHISKEKSSINIFYSDNHTSHFPNGIFSTSESSHDSRNNLDCLSKPVFVTEF